MEITQKQQKRVSMNQQVQDILVEISWGNISQQYFNKSRSWLSKKMNGKDFNGGEGDFTPEEKQTLKNALLDLAQRIKTTANNIQ